MATGKRGRPKGPTSAKAKAKTKSKATKTKTASTKSNSSNHSKKASTKTKAKAATLPKARRANNTRKKPIDQYAHRDKERVNNPPVGLVTPKTDAPSGKKQYQYDPHLDPQLVWAGKAEHVSFEVPTVSLHVHERIDPKTVIEAVKKKNGNGHGQMRLFETPEENPRLSEALDFYQHKHGWSNRLIAGDSLVVMNSLLEKEGLGGQVQMVYIDPPYGIKYGSNFQPFVNKRDVKDGKDDDLNQEPEMIRAFRDTWELGIHSYLTYLRDRLLLARELLTESGSCFVQISDENLHFVRNLMDETFGYDNFITEISFKTKIPLLTKCLANISDYLVLYAKDKDKFKYRQLWTNRDIVSDGEFAFLDLGDGKYERIKPKEREKLNDPEIANRVFRRMDLSATGYGESTHFPITYEGNEYFPTKGKSWKTHLRGMENLLKAKRIFKLGDRIYYKLYFSDGPISQLSNLWADTAGGFTEGKIFAVQTNPKVIERCILMTTDPGDLIFDPTCGSGTTAFVAEEWGRRWITCDTSRIAVTLAKQRLMTGHYDYYQLAYPDEGVGSGFNYRTIPRITLGSIANDEPPAQETLYDQPKVDRSRARVTGPFTVEAVPSPVVKPLSDAAQPEPETLDASIARSGETLRHAEWRDELLKTGVRGKNGQMILFSRVEPLAGTTWLHAEAETRPNDRGRDTVREKDVLYGQQPERVVVSFGPEHAPMEQNQVELAWEEARTLNPKPTILLFASFQFDPEAAKDIDELTPAKTGMTFLKVQMNTDLLTEDLKKKRSDNQSFWLIGQPDVEVRPATGEEHEGQWEVEVHGFDYYNTKTGQIESGDTAKIAMWMLDTDYDGRSLYPRQVFFPMSGEKDGWSRLAKNLKAEIDEELIEAYRGTVSLPFEAGKNNRVAVKIVDDRGIESLKILDLKG